MKPVGYFVSELTYRVKDLFRNNGKRIIFFCAAIVLALILGFRAGIKTELCAQTFANTNSLIYRYIADKMNVFSFILCEAFLLLVFCTLCCLTACNKILSYCVAILLFYRAFMLAYMLVLLISVFKLLILPYLLVCFIPLMLAYLLLFFLLGLYIGEVCDNGMGGFVFGNFTDCLLRLIPLFILFVLLAVAEGILTLVLTFGIVI